MSHQVCRDVTSWVDPVKRQVEECIRQDCNWLCLCCNKWLCGLVWVVIVAGKWVTETICEAVATVADTVVQGATALAQAVTRAWSFLLNLVTLNPEAVNKALGMHIIVESNEEGGWSANNPIELVGENNEKKYAKAFNNAHLRENSKYIDSGERYFYRIHDDGKVYFKVGNNPEERLLVHERDRESNDSPVERERGQIGIHFVHSRLGQVLRNLEFDMIAASGNRAFVREKNTANFYFVSMKHEFVWIGPPGREDQGNQQVVPGVYATLDAEHGKKINDYAPNPASKIRYKEHPSLKSFAVLSGFLQFLSGYIMEGVRVQKVYPKVWHRLDTRPPYSSGNTPWFVDTFNHVTYEGLIERKTYQSIRIHGVLDIGVGHTHRILHYETKYGDEVDTMNKVAYPAIAGPIEDGGGFCDGMCNFYVLCKIKIRTSILDVLKPANKLTYAILWIDEQTFFCERWRLVGFEDTDQNMLRAWGIGNIYSSLNVRSFYYWCPFETSWKGEQSLITDQSRLAVAKHTLVVNGLGQVRELHPDNTEETIPSQNDGIQHFHPILYTMNFSFATSDKTWRWRGYPCRAYEGSGWNKNPSGAGCYPETIRIREDMTIYLKGENAERIYGYWYQKYLPADNAPVPDKDHLNFGMPDDSYVHKWNFAQKNVFEAADNFSNFGVHRKHIDSRSQYYLLDIVNEDNLPSNFDSIPWKDDDEKLFWFYALTRNDSPSPYIKDHSKHKRKSSFQILKRKPLGYIAVWWDKRDDELPCLSHGFGNIKLRNEEAKVSLFTRKFDRRRKPNPPVVQCAKISVKVRHGEVEEFSVLFYSRMFTTNNFDWELYTPDEPNDSLNDKLLAKDSDIKDYVSKHTPSYLPHDNQLFSFMFKPDTSIFKAYITVETPLNSGNILTIFEGEITDSFSRQSRYEYLYEWHKSESGNPHPRESALLEYCNNNVAGKGTSLWFEDIVGHVATPERTIFNFDNE